MKAKNTRKKLAKILIFYKLISQKKFGDFQYGNIQKENLIVLVVPC
jgi:hypothetical protein